MISGENAAGMRLTRRSRLRVRPFATLLFPVAAAVVATAGADDPAPAPSGMRWIPGGEFTMGSDTGGPANERPAHRVRVSGFWMDATPVTNGMFARFVKATGYVTVAEKPPSWDELKKQLPPGTPKPDASQLVAGSLVYSPPDHPVPLDDLANWWRWVPGASWRHPEGPNTEIHGKDAEPVVQVAWDDAVAYARWAGKRLPTEAEWEYAARGGLDGKRFNWGDEFRPGGKYMANTFQGHFPDRSAPEDGFAGRSPVRAFPPNGYGLYDMAGNVWQWTSDWYRADAFVLASRAGVGVDPNGPKDSWDPGDPYAAKRVIKGGSYLCNVAYCESYRPSARRGTPPDTGSEHVGFRCAKSAPPPAAR